MNATFFNTTTTIATSDASSPIPINSIFLASAVMTIIAFLALILNLYLLICSRFLRRPIGVNLQLCVSLTLANSACAIFYILSNLINVLLPSILNQASIISTCFSLLIEVLKIGTFFASVFNLLALALNHYIGIVYPLQRGIITKGIAKIAIAFAYILPITAILALFSVVPGGFRSNDGSSFLVEGCDGRIFQIFQVRLAIVSPFIIFVISLTFLYAHLYIHSNQVFRDPMLVNSSTRKPPNRKLLITIMLLAGSAIMGWLPTLIQYILFCQQCFIHLRPITAFYIGVFSQLLNVFKLLADGFIYAQRLDEMRLAIQKFNGKILLLFPGSRNHSFEFSRYSNESYEIPEASKSSNRVRVDFHGNENLTQLQTTSF